MPVEYVVNMLATLSFAITGALAASREDVDLLGLTVLAVVTAVGGGTVRDIVLGFDVFWVADFNYVWAATAAALATFLVTRLFRQTYRLLLYADAFGVALFCIQAIDKVLDAGFSGPVAVVMGVLTGIGGGLLRDVLAGRKTLLMSQELYATPILTGGVLHVVLLRLAPGFALAGVVALAVIFGFRAAAIHWELTMPERFLLRAEATPV